MVVLGVAGPNFEVSIDQTNSPVEAGEDLEVDVTITNTGDTPDTQTIELRDFDDDVVDSREITLEEDNDNTSLTLIWETDPADAGSGVISVTTTSEDDFDRSFVELRVESVDIREPVYADASQFVVDATNLEDRRPYRLCAENVDNPAAVTCKEVTPEEDERTAIFDIPGDIGEIEVGDRIQVVLEQEEDRLLAVLEQEEEVGWRELVDDSTVVLAPPSFQVDIEETNAPIVEGERLNVNATIENVGDREDTQTIDLEIDGVSPDNTTLTLDGGESQTVSFSWETEVGDAGNYTAVVSSEDDEDATDVEVLEPAFFAVEIDETASPVDAGDDLTVSATVTNEGGAQATQTIRLDVAGFGETTSLTLASGDSSTVEFVWPTSDGDVGISEATVSSADDADAIDVEVMGPPEVPGQPFFAVEIVETNSPVTEGDALEVEVEVSNVGEFDDQQPVVLRINGTEVDAINVALERGSTETLTLTGQTAAGDGGEHGVTAASDDDESEATILVLEPGADIEYAPAAPAPDEDVSFASLIPFDDAFIQSYEWRVNGEVVSTDREFDHRFADSGEFEVELTVLDVNGHETTTSTTVTVADTGLLDDPGTAGLLLLLLILLLLAGYYYYRRRQVMQQA